MKTLARKIKRFITTLLGGGSQEAAHAQGDSLAAKGHEADKSADPASTAVDNASMEKLAQALVAMVNEFDTYAYSVSSQETKDVLRLCQDRVISALHSGGAELIEDGTSFCNDRHVAVPLQVVADGTPVKNILRKGLAWRGKVLLKAQVSV